MRTNHGTRRSVLSGIRHSQSGIALRAAGLPPPPKRLGAASWLLACCLSFSLTGCSIPLPQAQPDLTRYFVLGQEAGPAGATTAENLPVVRLMAVDVPAYLGDKPLAVRRGGNEIHYLDAARWAEPLDQGLERTLRLGLGATPGLTVRSRYDTTGRWDYDLKIRVTACEGSEDGHVLFSADWVLDPAPNSSLPRKAGAFTGQHLSWDGKSPALLVAALSQGVSQLCDTLAAALSPAR